jgi:hypothetical protein
MCHFCLRNEPQCWQWLPDVVYQQTSVHGSDGHASSAKNCWVVASSVHRARIDEVWHNNQKIKHIWVNSRAHRTPWLSCLPQQSGTCLNIGCSCSLLPSFGHFAVLTKPHRSHPSPKFIVQNQCPHISLYPASVMEFQSTCTRISAWQPPLKPVYGFQHSSLPHMKPVQGFQHGSLSMKPVYGFQHSSLPHMKPVQGFQHGSLPMKPVYGFQHSSLPHMKPVYGFQHSSLPMKPVQGFQHGSLPRRNVAFMGWKFVDTEAKQRM